LKRGVCSPDKIGFFTVGLSSELTAIKGSLKSISSGRIEGKSYFLEAPYGYGKSHLLKVIKSVALEQNFGVAQISHDSYNRAFNHPVRYIHYLYESLSVPELSTQGLGEVVLRLLRSAHRNSLLRWADTPSVRWGIGYYISRMANSGDGFDTSNLKYHINCCDIQFRSGAYYYLLYERLKILTDFCRTIGLSGLVVLFDEVESIATLLANIRSRLGSYEILSKLTDPHEFPYCCFCFAVSPDFGRKIENWDFRYEYRYYKNYYLEGCQFMDAWMQKRFSILEIQKISKAENIKLLQRLCSLHEQGYSWSAENTISIEFIESYLDEAEKMLYENFERQIIRSFVNILDICEQHVTCNPAQELSLSIIPPGKLSESEIYGYEPSFFFNLAKWAKEKGLLQSWDTRLLNDIGRRISNQWPISKRRKQRTLQIINLCNSAGFSDTTNQESVEESGKNQQSIINDVIETLTPREKLVIQLRYGLVNNTCLTLEEVGQQFNITRERIRQIQKKALRKLRHPSRSRKLKDMLNSALLDEGYYKLIMTIFGEK